MAASMSVSPLGANAAEGEEEEEETILYDLLVNTEWPPETEVQVTRPSPCRSQARAGPGSSLGADAT